MNNNQNPRQFRLFLGCFVALIATAFGFIIRALIIGDWKQQFNLDETQGGNIFGAGLAPFAISIILFSLIVDRLGYGKTMVVAFGLHILSAVLTITATGYASLYVATFIFALGNGAVEAVINPVVATIYDKNKTHWLNILHAGWPGGLVLGGLLTIFMGRGSSFLGMPGHMWQWKVALVLLPTIAYGVLLFGMKFPVSERVAAGVSYKDMLREFGAASCMVVTFMLAWGLSQILSVWGIEIPKWLIWGIIIVVPLLFYIQVQAIGQPIFVFLMLVMIPLAITELGTDSWIANLMEDILKTHTEASSMVQYGAWVLVYTSFIMFVLRFFAGPIVHRISPLGLLCTCAALAAMGLIALSSAKGVFLVFAAATLYGCGKSFFWPTTLGVVSEQFPKGGALTLNSIAGVGMLAAGILGTPLIGYIQDTGLVHRLEHGNEPLVKEYCSEKPWAFGKYLSLDPEKFDALKIQAELDPSKEATRDTIELVQRESKQVTLAWIAILPCIMFTSYVILIFHFRSKGGYRAQVLTGHAASDEEFTGGVTGPVE